MPPARAAVTTIVAVWLTLGVAFGLQFSFSVFLVPLLAEFGWARGAAAGAFSLSAVIQGRCHRSSASSWIAWDRGASCSPARWSSVRPRSSRAG